MTAKEIINSDSYWNVRFAENWEIFEGPMQSRFFAQIAIEHLPLWLIEQLQQQELTLADWGCAQGDGTDVWASYINAQQIVGVDFSSVAIAQATLRYPAIRFINEDWLANDRDQKEVFDIVFSSNTLEHFNQPYDVLNSLCSRAKKAIVLALPYQELERIDEHFFSFLPENIPLQLENGFRLIWSQVVDCRLLPNTLWSGHQIVLAYADSSWLTSFGLMLSDCRIEHSDPATEYSRLMAERDGQITERDGQIAERDGQIADLNQLIAERDGQTVSLNQVVTERDGQIERLHSAREMERRELMRLSDWAQQINERPLRYGIKKYLRMIVKAAFHSIPLDLSIKQGFKSRGMRFLWLSKELVNKVGMFTGSRGSEAGTVCQTALGRSVKTTSPCLLALANGGNLKGRDLFVFSVIDWHFRFQRPQHLARSFAKIGKRVFFFSNHFIDASESGYALERLDPSLDLYQVKLHVKGAPAIYFAPPTDEAMTMIQDGVAQLMMDFAAVSSVSLVQHAYWYPVADRLPNTLKVYDCMDHHEGFGNVPEQLIKIEKNMLHNSDLVVTTSHWLEEFARGYNRNVVLVRNAVEYAHFSEPPVECYVDLSGRKIIGYYGAIAEWFDLDLVRTVAEENPHSLVLLVGNDTIDAAKKLKDLTNVEFVGEVPYARLPYYLYAFDVCLLPFQVVPLTLATNPVKIYEYLASGKPVVSIDLPEITQFGDLVHLAPSHEEFVRMVSDCISQPEEESACHQRRQFAQKQTWDHRVEKLGQAIQGTPLPRISVVVLTYNNLDLTKACLDSLIRWSDYPNLEILVVDNASTDGSPDYLREFESKYSHVRLLLNKENLGFSAGNNVGLKAATGDYLVMLNNDTVVTPGWLLTMLRHLQSDPSVGLIGPVTNNIGNEAKIDIHYKLPAEMLPLAMDYTTRHMGRHFPIRTAAFFCVMMYRKVFEQVGLLDESFGRGFFEDDDYCRRVEAEGLRVACAEDVYVHHHLSASFDKLKSQVRQKLFEENMAIYEAKWGKWVPHTHQRDSSL